MKERSAPYLSAFCAELALLVHSGIPLGEGLRLLEGDYAEEGEHMLVPLRDSLEGGNPLSAALEQVGGFPGYLTNLVRLGEASGRLEEALSALSRYYENRQTLSENLRRAVTYPLLLLGLLTVVAVVVITQVIPIFYQMFYQVGVEMSGLALSLMELGRVLTSASAVLLALLALLVLAGIALRRGGRAGKWLRVRLERRWGDRGILGRVARSRFTMAMAMAISSGLHTDEAVSLAGEVCADLSGMAARAERCRTLLEEGAGLEEGLLKAGLLSPRESRLLALGIRAGETDTVMGEIAQRGEEQVLDELDRKLSLVEPALVILMSLIVGLILFSVMLPLMGIMSSLG